MSSGRKRKKKQKKAQRPPTIKKNEQAVTHMDTPKANTNSEVPPEAHQEDSASAQKSAPLRNSQPREQNAFVTNRVTLPAANEGKKSRKPTEQSNNPSNNQPPAKRSARDYKRRHDCCAIAANVVIAVATTAYVLVAVFQWCAMRGQLNAMQKQWGVMGEQLNQSRADSQLEYRPWVAVVKTHPQAPTVGKKIECTFEITNAGRTPALHVEVGIDYSVGPENVVVDWNDSPLKARPMSFMSRALILPNTNVVCTPISSETLEKMPRYVPGRKNYVYALVRINYTVLSGEERRYETRQAFIFDPNSTSLTAYDKYTDMT